MAIATMDQLLNALANNRQRLPFAISNAGTGTSYAFSFWRTPGTNKTSGNRDLVPTVCDNTTPGGLFYTNAALGSNLYIGRVNLLNTVVCDVTISDRLAHNGAITMATASTQNCPVDLYALSASDLTQNLSNRIGKSDFSEVRWRFESFTGVTTATGTITITYTNHLGVSGKTTTLNLGVVAASQVWDIVPQTGDYIRSIQSVTLGTLTGASGFAMIVAYNDRATISLPAINNMTVYDWEMLGLPRILEDSSLQFIVQGASSAGTLSGTIQLIQG